MNCFETTNFLSLGSGEARSLGLWPMQRGRHSQARTRMVSTLFNSMVLSSKNTLSLYQCTSFASKKLFRLSTVYSSQWWYLHINSKCSNILFSCSVVILINDIVLDLSYRKLCPFGVPDTCPTKIRLQYTPSPKRHPQMVGSFSICNNHSISTLNPATKIYINQVRPS